jgi:CPA2 family monovalent cation:H+ antiporter-2
MHEFDLLINLVVTLGVAFFGGLLARRIGLPTIVGYLLAGIAIGPFTPGFVGDVRAINQTAELGVIFLMFGVGLHFSLSDLWKVRDIAIPGALGQMAVSTALGLGLSHLWGWTVSSGLVLGLAISIASTVVLLRGLMDNGLLNTPHGQVAVGWLVLEDLATVLILVILPAFVSTGRGPDWQNIGLTLLKAGLFVGLMLVIGVRFVPWLLLRIAHTRSRELFILVILVIAAGTALASAQLFGVSLALGAFLAGVVVSESPLSHQVGADLLPFREAFAVLFFVSIGMLANPVYLFTNLGEILALSGLVVIGKAIITLLLGILLRHPLRTGLVVAAGLSQIGEFSFILAEAGLSLGMLNPDQHSLILAGALLSITANPLMFHLSPRVERSLQSWPGLRKWLDRQSPTLPVVSAESLGQHVVVVGYGRVGRHIVEVLGLINVPRLVVDLDARRVEKLGRQGVPVLFGDAANSEVLDHARLDRALALVVTIPNESAAEMVVAAARQLAPNLPIVARAATESGVTRLASLGAQDVIHPELEGGLEVVRHTLLRLGFPFREVQKYADSVRQDHYDTRVESQQEYQVLQQLFHAAHGIEIVWLRVAEGNPLVGQTLAQARIRAQTGTSVVAIFREGNLIPNPQPATVIDVGDRLGLIGEQEQIRQAESLLTSSTMQTRG